MVGFDDLPQAAQTFPALTTVGQPLHEMRRLAVRMFFSLVDGPAADAEHADADRIGRATDHRRRRSTRMRRDRPASPRVRRGQGQPVTFVMSYFTAADEALYLAESRGAGTASRRSATARCCRDGGHRGTAGPVHRTRSGRQVPPARDRRVDQRVHRPRDLRGPAQLVPAGTDTGDGRSSRGAQRLGARVLLRTGQPSLSLIWSSVVEPRGADGHRDWQNTGQDHRIWGCATSDFRTFSAAKLFFDPGYSVIDATVAHDGNQFQMGFKDERGSTSSPPATSTSC